MNQIPGEQSGVYGSSLKGEWENLQRVFRRKEGSSNPKTEHSCNHVKELITVFF